MRVTATHGVLHGKEGATPPLPWVTIDRREGAALVRSGIAVEVAGGTEVDAGDDLDFAYVLSPDGTENDFAVLDMVSTDDRFRSWFTAYLARHAAPAEISPIIEAIFEPEPNPSALAPTDEFAAGVIHEPGTGEGVLTERGQHIADALDLLEPEHMVSTGARVGKPKVTAVAEIVGFTVTAEEVDAAVAAKEAGE